MLAWLSIGGGVLSLVIGEALHRSAYRRKEKLDAECDGLRGSKKADRRLAGEKVNNRLFLAGSLMKLIGIILVGWPVVCYAISLTR